MVFEAVNVSMKQLLNPELTASWEKGLTYVSNGDITPEEYMVKLRGFVARRTEQVQRGNAGYLLKEAYERTKDYYKAAPARRERGTGRKYEKRRTDG